jgi:hypothetical protein
VFVGESGVADSVVDLRREDRSWNIRKMTALEVKGTVREVMMETTPTETYGGRPY